MWKAYSQKVIVARNFLGFTNYYHQFIYKYAKVAWPLYQLNLGENRSEKNKTILWYGESEEAFRKLKEICTSTPILAYADFSKPFELHTNVWTLGSGAILYQNQDGLIVS